NRRKRGFGFDESLGGHRHDEIDTEVDQLPRETRQSLLRSAFGPTGLEDMRASLDESDLRQTTAEGDDARVFAGRRAGHEEADAGSFQSRLRIRPERPKNDQCRRQPDGPQDARDPHRDHMVTSSRIDALLYPASFLLDRVSLFSCNPREVAG